MNPSTDDELEQKLLDIFRRHADAVLLNDEGAEPMLDDEDAVTEVEALLATHSAEAYKKGQIDAYEQLSKYMPNTGYYDAVENGGYENEFEEGVVSGKQSYRAMMRTRITAELTRLNSGLEQHNGQ